MNFNLPALGKNWEKIQLFEEKIKILDVTFHCVGFSTQNSAGVEVTGSAVSTFENPKKRAYFELLERASILEYIRDNPNQTLCSPQGHYQFSKSNGIAAHTELSKAKESAYLELTERDVILKSWFCKTPLKEITSLGLKQKNTVLPQLSSIYDWRFILFSKNPTFVVGCFGLPKEKNLNPVYGFGSGFHLHNVLQKSEQEAMQVLAFLWGEKFGAPEKVGPPGAHWHQSYWFSKKGEKQLRSWISEAKETQILGSLLPKIIEADFMDLTPERFKRKLYVIKAISEKHLPLVFGKYPYEKHFKKNEFSTERLKTFHPIQ